MKLTWIGHSCFRMEAQDGTVVITDPYDDSVGVEQVPLKADLITMSHEHHDHNCTEQIVGAPVIARSLEPAQVGGVSTHALGSYHDDVQGAKRGKNAIRVFHIDGLKVVHMGDQGCMPSDEIMEQIAEADVMLIPVGGFYTIDAAQAKALIDAAGPCCVVPMHVKTKRCGYPIARIWPFLELMGAKNAVQQREAELLPGHVPEGVLLMQPQTDEL